MTILVTDLNRADCTFRIMSGSLFIYHDGRFRQMGKLDEDIRFRDGIYRYDAATGELVNKAGASGPPSDATIVGQALIDKIGLDAARKLVSV